MQCVKCSVFPSLARRFSEGGQGVTESQVAGMHGKFRTLPEGTSSILTLTPVSAWGAQGMPWVCSNSHRSAEFPSKSTSETFSLSLFFFNIYLVLLDLRTSQVAQMVKNLPAVQEIQVQSLCREDPLEKGMAIHSCTLAWRIPWAEEPGGLQSMGSQRIRHDWAMHTAA